MKTILEGTMSTFGGPSDTGVGPNEGLALVDKNNFDAVKDYFLPDTASDTTGLARRLNPQKYYIACRWNYATMPKSHLSRVLVEVKNPRNGKTAQAKPVDWGPAAWTGRVADLSPGLAKFLGLATDDSCIVEIPHPGAVVSAQRRLDDKAGAGGSHLTVLSDAEIRSTFGAFKYKESPSQKGAIIIEPPWPRDHLIDITIPQLKGVPTYGGRACNGKITCHKKAAVPLQETFAAIEQQGLAGLLLFWGGGYVPRHKTWNPSRGLSSHSWGIAIDINPQWNGYDQAPAAKGQHGSVIELVPLFESFGFAWGGYFSDKDGMHFEYAKRT